MVVDDVKLASCGGSVGEEVEVGAVDSIVAMVEVDEAISLSAQASNPFGHSCVPSTYALQNWVSGDLHGPFPNLHTISGHKTLSKDMVVVGVVAAAAQCEHPAHLVGSVQGSLPGKCFSSSHQSSHRRIAGVVAFVVVVPGVVTRVVTVVTEVSVVAIVVTVVTEVVWGRSLHLS
jgi:hypothetical protein